jgi:type II secretory pathway pseudopilin PulG
MVADAVAGIALLAVLATSIIVATRGQQIASARLSESRGATWAAEQAMAELQGGKPAGEGIRVEPVDAGTPPPQGFAWVRVRAERHGRPAELIGLVPKTAVPAQGGQR